MNIKVHIMLASGLAGQKVRMYVNVGRAIIASVNIELDLTGFLLKVSGEF